MKLKSVVIASMSLLIASIANAQTFSNTNDTTIQYFGYPDTTNYGQVFSLAASATLTDWSFFAMSGGVVGDVSLVVAAWDGNKAVGPALYSAAGRYFGETQEIGFSGIDTTLAAGQFITYLTVAGVADPASSVTMAASNSDGGLPGGFRYLNSNGADPLALSDSWSSFRVADMQYKATFTPAVPEPETYALMLGGLGILGWASRRRLRA